MFTIANQSMAAGWKTFDWGLSKAEVLQEIKKMKLNCNEPEKPSEMPVCHTSVGGYKATVKFVLNEQHGLKQTELFIMPVPVGGGQLTEEMKSSFTNTLYRGFIQKYGVRFAKTKDKSPTWLWRFVQDNKTAIAFIKQPPAVKVLYSSWAVLRKIQDDEELEMNRKREEQKRRALELRKDI
ncbi:hypothetical protein HOF92_03575 [bacterium]|nr:hypothetical protein [bacterium]